jgi:hypothetical protein
MPAGGRLAAALIPQACMTGIRAEPFDFGSAELVALEAFLAKRAAGMTVETPGVRPWRPHRCIKASPSLCS